MQLTQQQRSKAEKTYTADIAAAASLQLTPIGIVHSPHRERFSAPRQPSPQQGSATATTEMPTATIALLPEMKLAVRDLEHFSHIWIIYWLHLNQGWNPLVRPPGRGDKKRGVLATRGPHRPNPIGLSAVRLLAIEENLLTIDAGDLLDGTPVLDIKPYLPYADRIEDANSGWLEESS
ncbi:MAG: tRNA (N6-threonylcarbamoyladenosine(37)-N6)-methyltransferase TrmO [Mariprofundales bacterium]